MCAKLKDIAAVSKIVSSENSASTFVKLWPLLSPLPWPEGLEHPSKVALMGPGSWVRPNRSDP